MIKKDKKEIIVTSNIASDREALADLLRCYGYTAAEAGGGLPGEELWEDWGGGAGPAPALPSLTIRWTEGQTVVDMDWRQGNAAFNWRQKVLPAPFEESPENRRRRVLRLCFHHLVSQMPGSRPSPWGVLTGVRPAKVAQRFLDEGLSGEAITRALTEDYGIAAERAETLYQIAVYQRPFLPALTEGRERISVYIGYPFCPSRCAYCSFPGYDLNKWRKRQPECVAAMLEEIRAVGRRTRELGLKVQTLYFGGGTPTAMGLEQMDSLLAACRDSFDLMPEIEWTIEGGRPDTLTEDMLRTIAAYPVNRICVNPQSMRAETLARIGRKHSPEEIRETFRRVRRISGELGLGWSVNSDLILGLPGETAADVADTLEEILAFRPENITVHSLAIKRGSAFQEVRPELPELDEALAMAEVTRQKLLAAGYLPYYLYRQKEILASGENIGYALPGQACLYNILMIEERQTILGLGVGSGSKYLTPGAWSLENAYNPKDLIQYIERIPDLIQRKVDKLGEIG